MTAHPSRDACVARWAQKRWCPGTPIGDPFPSPFREHSGLVRIAIPPGRIDYALVPTDPRPGQEWVSIGRTFGVEQMIGGVGTATLAAALGKHVLGQHAAAIWTHRMLYEAGALELLLPLIPALPNAKEPARHVLGLFALLVAIRAVMDVVADTEGTPFSARFAGHWCGLPVSTAHDAIQWLCERGVLEHVGCISIPGSSRRAFTYRLAPPAATLPSSGPASLVRGTNDRRGLLSSEMNSRPEDASLVRNGTASPAVGAGVPSGRLPEGFEPEVVVALDEAPPCRHSAHHESWAWRVPDGRCWTCTDCYGPPRDPSAVVWGRQGAAQ